jgi:polyisoprenoid-binding protein YceI
MSHYILLVRSAVLITEYHAGNPRMSSREGAMKKITIFNIIIISIVLGFASTSVAAETYILDPDHSAVVFRIKHFGMDFMSGAVGDKVVLTISVEGVRE